MFLVRCPGCLKTMKTDPRVTVTKAVKRCVYCGKSFKIHSNMMKSNIVKEIN